MGAETVLKAEEIEITPEMIEAGCRELALFSSVEDSAEGREDVVAAIYEAMSRLTRGSLEHTSRSS